MLLTWRETIVSAQVTSATTKRQLQSTALSSERDEPRRKQRSRGRVAQWARVRVFR